MRILIYLTCVLQTPIWIVGGVIFMFGLILQFPNIKPFNQAINCFTGFIQRKFQFLHPIFSLLL